MLLLQNLAGGGAERVMLRLARGLHARGRSIELVLLRWEGEYLAEVEGAPWITFLGAGRTRASLPRLLRHIRTRRPRWIISALAHVNVAALLAARLAASGTRVMVTEHNRIDRRSIRSRTTGAQIAYRVLPWVYPLADEIVAVSTGVADDLAAFTRIGRDRVRVIYNPIVTADIASRAVEGVDHPWFTPGAAPVIISAGRLHRQKNFGLLLRAFAELRSTRPARLMILGQGEERVALETTAHQLGISQNVAFLGFVANPFAYFSRARIFALSSDWEGLPTALVEALACGTPVVSTDCPHGPREILQGGAFGSIVPCGDHKALARRLAEALDAPLPGDRLRARAELFSEARAVASYDELIAGRGANPRAG